MTAFKDMIGIPWMLAFALRDTGWYLRNDIIWMKDNPIPKSVKDLCDRCYEHIFLSSKLNKYFFDYPLPSRHFRFWVTIWVKPRDGAETTTL